MRWSLRDFPNHLIGTFSAKPFSEGKPSHRPEKCVWNPGPSSLPAGLQDRLQERLNAVEGSGAGVSPAPPQEIVFLDVSVPFSDGWRKSGKESQQTADARSQSPGGGRGDRAAVSGERGSRHLPTSRTSRRLGERKDYSHEAECRPSSHRHFPFFLLGGTCLAFASRPSGTVNVCPNLPKFKERQWPGVLPPFPRARF